MELSASLFAAMEEANYLLHHVWIHVLGSKYHPQVKQIAWKPDEIKDLTQPEDWDLTANPLEATAPTRSRTVHFTIVARKTDEQKAQENYQLTFTVHLHELGAANQWFGGAVSKIRLMDVQTSESQDLGIKMPLRDCMCNRTYRNSSPHSNFELAKAYFA